MCRKIFLFLLAFMLSATACTMNTTSPNELIDPANQADQDTILVLGDISDEAAETINGTQPLADHLAEQLKEHGISHGVVKIAPNLETMIAWMNSGEVDLYFDSPYPVLVISDETGAVPILRRFRFGMSQYHSIFITRYDSPLQSLADLSGQMVAFEEAFSTSGYMLPLAHLLENQMNPVEKGTPDTAVAADEVGYVFSTADNTSIQWVISGKIAAGVIDNITFSRLPEETQAQLKIIGRTEDVPRQLVLVQPNMTPELMEAIRQALLAVEETAEGRAALEAFQTTAFAEFEEDAQTELARMRQIYSLVDPTP